MVMMIIIVRVMKLCIDVQLVQIRFMRMLMMMMVVVMMMMVTIVILARSSARGRTFVFLC